MSSTTFEVLTDVELREGVEGEIVTLPPLLQGTRNIDGKPARAFVSLEGDRAMAEEKLDLKLDELAVEGWNA